MLRQLESIACRRTDADQARRLTALRETLFFVREVLLPLLPGDPRKVSMA